VIVTPSTHSSKPRHAVRSAIECGHKTIHAAATWPAELFLNGARVANEDDSIAVQSIDGSDCIVAGAAEVGRKQQTAAMIQMREEAVRATARIVLKRVRGDGKVARCRRPTDPNAALIVGQQRVGGLVARPA
jgi:hypothetical protein